MAKPITNIKHLSVDEEKRRQNDLNEVEAAIADNKESVLAAITLTRHLHDKGLLDILNGALSQGEEVLDIAVKEINRPQNSRVIENGVGLAMLLGTLDVDRLKVLTKKLNQGVRLATADRAEEDGPDNVFQLMKLLKDPEINRSIGLLVNFLKGMSRD
ncbi:DUF1641 domain-containing protein [Lentibacillus lipolyticus]|nr:DUF1641 domain-containing protein [Lentibacillus lipolyticus]